MSCLKNQGGYKNAPDPRFYPTQCVKGKIKVIFKIFIEVHFLFNLSRTWLNTK